MKLFKNMEVNKKLEEQISMRIKLREKEYSLIGSSFATFLFFYSMHILKTKILQKNIHKFKKPNILIYLTALKQFSEHSFQNIVLYG